MKNKLSLQDVQRVSTEVLSDVHNFCIAHNINYSLAYGTLIGAIRHKGFIPWDDDIDIIMLRPDYERFCKEYKSHNCKLITAKDSYINYARVCDCIKTKYQTISPWTTDKTVGVWIDIFPLDAVEDDFTLFSNRISRFKVLLDRQVNSRMALCNYTCYKNPKDLFTLWRLKQKYSNTNLNTLKNEIESIVNEIPFGSTKHVSQLVCRGNSNKEFFTLDMFLSFSKTKFENYEFLIANGWEDILKLNFGDYMQLPPKDQQVPHGGFVDFFWKK